MTQLFMEDLFPTRVYHCDIEIDNDAMIKKLYEMQKTEASLRNSMRLGWHSPTILHTLPEFHLLCSFILNLSKAIDNFYISNMWGNILPKYGYNVAHTHPNSAYSGVYYLNKAENSGNLVLMDPRPGHVAEYKYGGDVTTVIEGTQGKLVMFPNWLEHRVEQNLSEEDRIAVSFNLGKSHGK